ncbi:ankyrin [Lizonia empirigonia]|nr:ankyrin [Lizonia empirigonia]
MTPLEYLFERGGESQDIEDREEEDPGQTSLNLSEAGLVQKRRTGLEHTPENGASEDIDKADSGSARHEESDTEQVSEDEDHRESDKSGAEPIGDPQEDTEELDSQTSDDEQQDLADRKQKIFIEIASKKLDYHDDRDRTLLYYAIQNTNIETIGQLISKGYKLESKDAAGLTPLHFAIQIRKSKIALKLLRALPGYDGTAASASARDDRGYTPLMFAAENGCMSVVRYLVESLPGKMREERERLPNEEKRIAEYGAEARPGAEADSSGPLARDSGGRTALHIALNLATCVRSILDKWPGFHNKPDAKYKQTPLSFACEAGTESVVDWLLSFKDMDVNAKAPGWNDISCLHAAVIGNCLSIVEKLVGREDIKINEKNSFGETALETALYNSGIAKVLLLHKHTESKARLEFLSRNCTDRDVDYQKIVPDILPYVEDADITNEVLVDLIDVGEELRSSEPFVAFVRRAFERGTPLERPYHKAARVGRLELLYALQKMKKDPNELDDDGWSCIEYAETYCGSPLNASFARVIHSARSKRGQSQEQDSSSIRPGLLHEPCFKGLFQASFEPTLTQSLPVIEVVSSNDNWRATIRTRNCVPPASAKNGVYYFEVKILTETKSRIFGLGFCNKSFLDETMPGWHDISCGYHGDDGALFINSGTGQCPTADFGPSGMYGVGDTVGAGLNMATGEVFFTLNGVRRNAGDAFKDEKFNGRKMYPCIGFDTSRVGIGLRVEMNLGSCLKTHPFVYADVHRLAQPEFDDSRALSSIKPD